MTTITDMTESTNMAASVSAKSEPTTAASEPLLKKKSKRIDHIAIAVLDLEAAIKTFRETMGFEVVERRLIQGKFSGMDSAVVEVNGVTFVLVQGTSPDSNVSKYIDRYGPGVQHVAIEVDDIDDVVEDLKDQGADMLTGVIRSPGLDQAFTRRELNSGMQLEFVSRADNDGFSDKNVQELFEAMEREDVY